MPRVEHPWTRPDRKIERPMGAVHLWRSDLDLPAPRVEQLEHLLSDDERARANRFHLAVHRARFIIGRGTLRSLLGDYLEIDPRRLSFQLGPSGKPALNRNSETIRFNIAHSHHLALFAFVDGRELGVDLERTRPMEDANSIVSRFFSPREVAEFFKLSESDRPEAFFRCWTRKEAYVKATGEGLSLPLDSFDVTLVPDEPPRLLRVEGRPGEVARWVFHHLEPAEGFLGALAVEGERCPIQFFDVDHS